jgi:hypothetical protein
MTKIPFPKDKTALVKFMKNECFEKKRNLGVKAKDQVKNSLEQSLYEMNSNIYAHLWLFYGYIDEITESINTLTIAIDKLPTEYSKAAKEELKHVVKEASTLTKQDIKEYKEHEKRTKHIYG